MNEKNLRPKCFGARDARRVSARGGGGRDGPRAASAWTGLEVVGRADGAEADVGPDDLAVSRVSIRHPEVEAWGRGQVLRVGELSLDLGGDTRVRGAVATGGAGLALLLGRVDGVEPEHVGVVLRTVSC